MRLVFVFACALAAPLALVCACGESRRPIGEECLRDEDCLSNFCAARACVSAPSLVTGASGSPDDEEPLIPTGDGASSGTDGGDPDGA
ncbi:MAG: hypothetical protein KIS78_01360 [Labilithrix sp.]|nr:hypothetical protein [Labilithrix sp.]MCW5831088.1 hypothetical protein [Labilithrix sp.]